jgi:hypothetical protein
MKQIKKKEEKSSGKQNRIFRPGLPKIETKRIRKGAKTF